MTATTPAPAGAIVTSPEPDTDAGDAAPAGPAPAGPVATTDAAPAPAPAGPTIGLTDYVTVLIVCDYHGGPDTGESPMVAIWSVIPPAGRRARRRAVNRDISAFIARHNHHVRAAGWLDRYIVRAREVAVVAGHIELADGISRPPAQF